MPAYSIQMYRAYHHWTHLWLNFNMLRIWLWISKCVGLGFTFIPKLPKRNTFGHLDLVFVSYFLCWPVIINIHTSYAGLTSVEFHTGRTLYTCFNSNVSRLGTLTIKGYTAVAISPFFSSLKTKSKLSACFCHIYVFPNCSLSFFVIYWLSRPQNFIISLAVENCWFALNFWEITCHIQKQGMLNAIW